MNAGENRSSALKVYETLQGILIMRNSYQISQPCKLSIEKRMQKRAPLKFLSLLQDLSTPSSSSSSSSRDDCTVSLDFLPPSVPIIHRSVEVHKTASSIRTELIKARRSTVVCPCEGVNRSTS